MKRTLVRFSQTLGLVAGLGVLGGISLHPSIATAQDADYPPAEYIATAEPVYYEGHPAYWYGNRWYYRNGGAWNYYHGEPGYLRDWRGRPGWGARYHYGAGYYGHGYHGGGYHGGGGWHGGGGHGGHR